MAFRYEGWEFSPSQSGAMRVTYELVSGCEAAPNGRAHEVVALLVQDHVRKATGWGKPADDPPCFATLHSVPSGLPAPTGATGAGPAGAQPMSHEGYAPAS